MGTKKYFFFDYDGTLAVPRTREIPESTQWALEQLRQRGHFVALNTGRLQCNALDYIARAGINNIVADGGYSVTVDGKLLWMRGLDVEPVKACLHRLDAAGIPWAVTTANEQKRYSNNPRFAEIAGDYYVPTFTDPDLRIDQLETVFKVYIPCDLSKAHNLVEAGLLDGVPWVTYTSNTVFIEPLSKDVGIRYLMEYWGAPLEDVVVFGDGKNDRCMFRPEWTSIAMGNAEDQLKAMADYVTTDCDKDGILNACRHFGWL